MIRDDDISRIEAPKLTAADKLYRSQAAVGSESERSDS